jgi:dihydroorotate dehydrogenase electron transfer subunit
VKTFTFKDTQCIKAKPGQFLMLWIPKVDEIPLSILDVDKNGCVSVAVKNVGEASNALHNMEAGEIVGVRGPFGNSFTVTSGNVLIVGGGMGMAPLLFLTKRLRSAVKKLIIVIGAKTKAELLFMEDLEGLCKKGKAIATTEDGTCGLRCLATTPLEQILVRDKFGMVYTCGPEQMMLDILNLAEAHKVKMEASLERLMRCAMGLCGSCVIGRYRVCRDGPVFSSDQLGTFKSEFGHTKLNFDGRRMPL